MMGRSSLTAEGKKTVRSTKKVHSIQTVNEIVEVSQEAEVHVKELNTCVVVTLVDDSASVFSLGRAMRRRGVPLHLDTKKEPTIDERWNFDSVLLQQKVHLVLRQHKWL